MKTLFLILALIPVPVSTCADEPKPSVVDAHALLRQTELNVLTRQYEKALTEFYDAQLQRQMISAIEGRDNLSKEEAERQVELIELRVKLLKEWQREIRQRILALAEEHNDWEKARQVKDQKSNPAKQPASSSERAPTPKF